MNSRLSISAPDIEKILSSMSEAERLVVVSRAILWVADAVGLDSSAIEKTLKEKHHERLLEIAQEFDSRYFELQELSDPEHLTCFSKARCYNAAAFLAHGNVYEAIYEAIAATDAPQNIRRILNNEPCS
jgi:hypothetical protein